MKTHYHTLGVSPDSETSEIKKAYFELAKKYHPDSNNSAEVKKFQQITEAYKTLTNADLKKLYDETLKTGLDILEKAEAHMAPEKASELNFQPQKRDKQRELEFEAYQKNRYWQAVFRVLLLVILATSFGFFLTLLVGGIIFVNGAVGAVVGLSFSLQKNFDIKTFFDAPKKSTRFKMLLSVLIVGGILYFLSLLLFAILKAG